MRTLFFLTIAALISILYAPYACSAQSSPASINIVASTFPMYQLARTITQGREGVRLSILLPAQTGCPHDYALTPHDMRKLAEADILLINGLGLEEFISPGLLEANPGLRIVDASHGVHGLLYYTDAGSTAAEHADARQHGPHCAHEHTHDPHGMPEHAHAHEHTGVNAHIFASPVMLGRMALSAAHSLAELDPDGGPLYRQHAQEYATRLTALADELRQRAGHLRTRAIMTQHGVFDYLARDLGLHVVGVVQAHDGQEPSAAQLAALVHTAKGAGAVFAEPQYPQHAVQTIAREAGIAFAVLDSTAAAPEGHDNIALDYFEQTMRRNMDTLEQCLGVRQAP